MMEIAATPDLLTLKETTAWLRIHTSTLYRMVKRGQIPVFRVGSGPFSDWRFLRHAVERWVLDRIEGEAIRRAPLIDEATRGVIDEATGQVIPGPLARGADRTAACPTNGSAMPRRGCLRPRRHAMATRGGDREEGASAARGRAA